MASRKLPGSKTSRLAPGKKGTASGGIKPMYPGDKHQGKPIVTEKHTDDVPAFGAGTRENHGSPSGGPGKTPGRITGSTGGHE